MTKAQIIKQLEGKSDDAKIFINTTEGIFETASISNYKIKEKDFFAYDNSRKQQLPIEGENILLIEIF